MQRFGNVLQASLCIFIIGTILHVLMPITSCTNPVGASVTVIAFVVTLTYLLQEDNHVWEGSNWVKLYYQVLTLEHERSYDTINDNLSPKCPHIH